MRTVLLLLSVLLSLAVGPAALAQAAPSDPPPGASREAWISYQRERLAIQGMGDHGFRVVDGYGRALSARQVARAFGDITTYDSAARANQVQQAVGASATIGGPVVMLLGLSRISVADRRSSGYQRAAGYGMLVAGMAGTAVGIGLLSDRRPRMPSTFYTKEQASRLIEAHNLKLRDTYGIPHERGAWLPPRPRNDRELFIGLAGVGVRGSF